MSPDEQSELDSTAAVRIRDLLDLPVRELLQRTAAEFRSPAGGSAAAVAIAMGAALTAMAARAASGQWDDADGAAAQADALRKRVAPLAQADADAFDRARLALAAPEGEEQAERDAQIGDALSEAAGALVLIAEAGSEVASLAALTCEKGDADARGDSVTATLLAEAGTQAAANLVEINLATREGDRRIQDARRMLSSASAARTRALAAAP
jgi:methenyltetrahydrofolate cyclohydrolase